MLVKDESERLASDHVTFAAILKDNIVDPLRLWSDETRKIFEKRKLAIETQRKLNEKLMADVDKKQLAYTQSCQASDKLRQEVQEALSAEVASNQIQSTASAEVDNKLDLMIRVGPAALTAEELKTLVSTMQEQITQREFKYPLLGSYRVVSGAEVAAWLIKSLSGYITGPEDATAFGQGLCDKDIFRLVGRGKLFVAKDNWYYQWHKSDLGVLEEKLANAVAEADANDLQYKVAVEAAEQARIQYVKIVTDHICFIENVELSRLSTIKYVKSLIERLYLGHPFSHTRLRWVGWLRHCKIQATRCLSVWSACLLKRIFW